MKFKKNTAHVDFDNINLDNNRFVKVNSLSPVQEHLTINFCVDNAVFLPTLVKSNQNNGFNNKNLTKIIIITINSEPTGDYHFANKSCVDSLSENDRHTHDLSIVLNDPFNELDNNKLTRLDSIRLSRKAILDEEVANEQNLYDELDKDTILRFNHAFEQIFWKSPLKLVSIILNIMRDNNIKIKLL